MSREENAQTGWGSIAAVLLLVMLPILYVASLGPAVHYHGRCPRPVQQGIETLYRPLEWLRNNTPLQEPLDAYVELWRD